MFYNITSSLSRTYIAICSGWGGESFLFYKFILPRTYKERRFSYALDKFVEIEMLLENNNKKAEWYFQNRLTTEVCVVCVAVEDMEKVIEL